ncbi:MAG: fibronectin type III domain-containing protein [Elusimicrobiota bacterium]
MKKLILLFSILYFLFSAVHAASSDTITCYFVIQDTVPPANVSISSCSAGSHSQITVYFAANDTGSGLAGSPYYVEMSTASNFGGDVTNSGWISQTSYAFSGLTRNKKYYFRLKAKDNAGNVSDPSSVVNWRTKPGTYQEKTTTRTGANSFGFVGDGLWEWEVAAKSGQLVTITAYIRYNASYGAAGKPKLTLYNLGVNSNATMSASSDTWEQLQVSGTPNRNGILKLKIEGYSTVPGAKMFVDDISISQ